MLCSMSDSMLKKSCPRKSSKRLPYQKLSKDIKSILLKSKIVKEYRQIIFYPEHIQDIETAK